MRAIRIWRVVEKAVASLTKKPQWRFLKLKLKAYHQTICSTLMTLRTTPKNLRIIASRYQVNFKSLVLKFMISKISLWRSKKILQLKMVYESRQYSILLRSIWCENIPRPLWIAHSFTRNSWLDADNYQLISLLTFSYFFWINLSI